MENKRHLLINVPTKTLLVIIVLFVITIGLVNYIKTTATESQEIVVVNGERISYRDGGYVYINTEHSTKGGEFRGVWVSPLTGDIGNYVSKDSYQSQMLDVLEKMEYYNLNVMIFHVRIMNDALYESKYNSWSSYYNTNPDWDALPWLIEECHKRGIEFHAWMNPYRVTTNVQLSLEDCAKRYKPLNAASNPKNLLKADKTIILNPGEPEVKEFLVNTCMELVENYDVDAIHFDDYFYAAGIDDSETIRKYNTTGLSEADFRRKQVDDFIEMLSESLRSFNLSSGRRVQLGIAPTGVWKNGNGVVTYDASGKAMSSGSRTSAYAHYGSPLYADTLKWINNNWIDYILPQTYWAITNGAGPYCDLVKWWNLACKNSKTNLYSSLGLYMNSGGNASWSTNHYEGYQQIMLANTLENVRGCSIYNYTSYVGAVNNPDKSFRGVPSIWCDAAYLPEIRTMDAIIPKKVEDLTIRQNDYGYTIRYKKMDDAKFYCIYRSTSPLTYDESEIIDIIGNIEDNGYIEYTDSMPNNKTYYYGVRSQSNSLTLGEGVSVSTINIEKGSNPSIGKIEGLSLSFEPVEDNEVQIKFDKVNYPVGNAISYEIAVVYYNGSTKVKGIKLTPTYNGSFYTSTLDVMSGATSLEVTVKAKNDRGETSTTKTYAISKNIGKINNFAILDTNTFNGSDARFVWNNLMIDDTSYIIEYSLDKYLYNDLYVIDGNSYDGFNININNKLYDTLQNVSKNVYYRVKAVSSDGIGYSDIVSINQYNYLGEIEGITIEGLSDGNILHVEEGDEIIISWDDVDSDIIYTLQISYDGKNWFGSGAYDRASFSELVDGNYYGYIPVNYSSYHFYVRVLAVGDGARSASDAYSIYVHIDQGYADEIIGYLFNTYSAFLGNMDVYN